ALKVYDTILLSNPNDAEIANRKGEILLVMDRPAQAAEAFANALSTSPKSPVLLNNLGKAMMKLRRTDEALRYFREAIGINPKEAEYRVNEGRALAAEERLEEAMQSFETALLLKPGDYQALKYKGNLLLRMGKASDALKSFEKALESSKGDKDLFRNMGKASELLGRTREAIAHYGQCLDEDPSDKAVWTRMGQLRASLGEHKEAIDCFDKVISMGSEDPTAWLSKGMSLEAMGKLEEAVQAYDQAIGIDANIAEIWEKKGSALLKLYKPEQALRAFEHATALNPSSEGAKKGLQESEKLVRELKIEDYARAVLDFEYAHRRPVTKEEAFRIAGIPYAFLDDVLAYIQARVDVNISELTPDEINAFEEASREILLRAYDEGSLETHGLSLADIIRNFPDYKISTAKKILAYIQTVSDMTFSEKKSGDPETEHLLRAALDLPDTEKNVLGIMRNLNLGVMKARRLVTILQTFRGGGYETPTLSLRKIVTEGFGGERISTTERVGYAPEVRRRETEVSEEPEEIVKPARKETGGRERIEEELETVAPSRRRKEEVERTRRGHPAEKGVSRGTGLDRDTSSIEGRRCLFHGGIAIGRCMSCKAILCKECIRGVSNCPRCGSPLSETASAEEEAREEKRPKEPPEKTKEREEKQRDFSRL
ncbi:MAG: tetratricopeptide repeat protein, partial [Thermoplasmata archaeon]